MIKIYFNTITSILFLVSFSHAQNGVITVHGTGDPNTSAQIRIKGQGDNKSYVLTDELVVEGGAKVVAWGPEALGDAVISGDGDVIFISQLSINLNEEWNWISSNIYPPDPNVEVVWSDITDLNIVKSYSGFYVPGVYNGIGNWDITAMYKAHLSSPATLIMEGEIVDPALPIELVEDWNWVSYLPDQAINAEIALMSINQDLNIVKAYEGFYVPGVYNGIGNMFPGKGYAMHTRQACTLIYPSDSLLAKRLKLKNLAIVTPEKSIHFTEFKPSNDYQAFLVQSIFGKGVDIKKGDEVGIYSESGLCLGGAKLTDSFPLGIMVWMDNPRTEEIDGFKPGENFIIKYWAKSTDEEYPVNISIKEGANQIGKSELIEISLEVDISMSLESVAIPLTYTLEQNYPNPFNPQTTIRYGIPEDGTVSLTIYNLEGKLIKRLENRYKAAGYHQILWDGTNDSGKSISTGVYIYRMMAGKFSSVRKMVFLK
jgi:hypothetical protein